MFVSHLLGLIFIVKLRFAPGVLIANAATRPTTVYYNISRHEVVILYHDIRLLCHTTISQVISHSVVDVWVDSYLYAHVH